MPQSPRHANPRPLQQKVGTRPRRRSGAASAYSELRRMIIDMTLAPGRELDEAELVSWLGVSRTPIREALFRLAAEGLVIQVPNRGAHVAPVDLSNLRQYFEALDYLQRGVNRLAALRRSEPDVVRLQDAQQAFEAAMSEGEPSRINAENRHFHGIIADAAGNAHLGDSYRRLLVEGSRIAYLVFLNAATVVPGHLTRTAGEHRDMVDAIRARDADRAEALGRDHADLFRERVIRSLASSDDALAATSVSG